jgi:hypothetical protein
MISRVVVDWKKFGRVVGVAAFIGFITAAIWLSMVVNCSLKPGFVQNWYFIVAIAPFIYLIWALIVFENHEMYAENKRPLAILVAHLSVAYLIAIPFTAAWVWFGVPHMPDALIHFCFAFILFLHVLPFLMLEFCTVEEQEHVLEFQKVSCLPEVNQCTETQKNEI